MAAQKITRKQLKQDGFVAWTEQALEFVQRNYLMLGLAVLALIVVLVGSSWYRQSKVNSRLEASSLLFQGQTALAEGSFDAARVSLQDCIDRHGGSPFATVARVDLARALHGAGDSEAALVAADGALTALPADDRLRWNAQAVKATILGDLERYTDAATVYSAILGDEGIPDRQRIDLVSRLAVCYERDNRPGEAQRVLEELRSAIVNGDVEGNVRTLDPRIEFYRALANR